MELGVDDNGKIDALGVWVLTEGPKAAAWLVGKHRREIRLQGWVDFTIPSGKDAPPWFRVAVETLRRRKGEKWSVRAYRQGRVQHYVVRWNCWGGHARFGAPRG